MAKMSKLGDIYCFGSKVRVEETSVGEYAARVYKLETQQDEDENDIDVFALVESFDNLDEALSAASAL